MEQLTDFSGSEIRVFAASGTYIFTISHIPKSPLRAEATDPSCTVCHQKLYIVDTDNFFWLNTAC